MALTSRIKAVIRSLGKRGDPLASATSDLIKSVETLQQGGGGPEPGDGLVIADNAVKVNLGTGLEFDSSNPKKVRAKLGYGLINSTSGTSVFPRTAGSIGVDGNGVGVQLSSPSGLTSGISGLALDLASQGGLQLDESGKLAIKTPETGGVYTDAAGLSVQGFVAAVGIVTTDDTPTPILTIPLSNSAKGFCLNLNVVGYKADGSKVCAYNVLIAARTDGTTATIGGSQKTTAETDFDCDVDVVASGNSIVVKAIGQAATSMKWKCLGFFV